MLIDVTNKIWTPLESSCKQMGVSYNSIECNKEIDEANTYHESTCS